MSHTDDLSPDERRAAFRAATGPSDSPDMAEYGTRYLSIDSDDEIIQVVRQRGFMVERYNGPRDGWVHSNEDGDDLIHSDHGYRTISRAEAEDAAAAGSLRYLDDPKMLLTGEEDLMDASDRAYRWGAEAARNHSRPNPGGSLP